MGAINNEGDIESGIFELGSNNNADNPYFDEASPNGGFNPRASGKGLAGNDDYQFLLWLDKQSKKGLSTQQLMQQKSARAVSPGYWNIFDKDEAEQLHEMSFYGKSVSMINKYAITAPISSSYMKELEDDVKKGVSTGRLGGSKMNNKYLPGSDTKDYLNANQNFENEVLLRMAYRYNIDIPKGMFNTAGQLKSSEERDMGTTPEYENTFKGEVYRAHVYGSMGTGKGKELDKSVQDLYFAAINRAQEQKNAGRPYPYNSDLYKNLGITATNWNDYIKDLKKEGPAKYRFTKFQDLIRVDQRDVEKDFNNVYPASSIREFVKANMPTNVVGWALGNYEDAGMTKGYSKYNYLQTTNTLPNGKSIDRLRGAEANGIGPAMFMSRMIDNSKVWRETDFDAVYGKDVWKKTGDGGPEDMSVAVKSFYEDYFPQELKDIKSNDPLMDYKRYFYGDAGKDVFENAQMIGQYSTLDNDFGVGKMDDRAAGRLLNEANQFFAKNIDTIDMIGSITNTMNFIKDTVGNVGEAILGGVDTVINFGEDIIHGKNIAKSTGKLFFKMGEEVVWDPIEQTYYDAKEWNDKQQELLEYDPGSVVIPDPGSNADSPFDDSNTGVVDQSGDNINEDGSTASSGGSSTGSGTGSGGGGVSTGVAGGVLENLRRMLGIAGTANSGKKIIDELVNPGGELPKLADSMFRPEQRDAQGNVTQEAFGMQDLMAQQAQVAEQGYDIGEREALSAKSRRELAGLARQQGMAAGAASGGIRGASTAAQARSLMEKAMMKQADVTTEMDKAAISRKDSARQQLANLAQGVYGFDISREEDARKRRSATVLGIENLQQQAANAAAQLRLAESD